MSITRKDLETMRALHMQVITAKPADKWFAQARLLTFITETKPDAFAYCIEAGREKAQREARAA